MKVQLFIPLVIDQCAPELGFQVIKLLENISCEVIVPSSQTSSGEELYSKGDPHSVQTFLYKAALLAGLTLKIIKCNKGSQKILGNLITSLSDKNSLR